MELRFERASETIRDKAVIWAEGAVAMLPNLVVALIVMIAFALAARFIGKTLRSLLGKMSPNKSVVNLLVSILKIGIWSIGLFIALGVLKLDKTVTTLLASIGIIGLALGFAFQDIAANLISGIFLLIRHPFAPGDLIETNGFFGTVTHTTLRNSFLVTPEGKTVVLPNRLVFENPLVNYSSMGVRRVDLSVGVSYREDLAHVKEVALAAIRQVSGVVPDRLIDLIYTQFNDSSIDFSVRFWVKADSLLTWLNAKSEAIMAVKKPSTGKASPFHSLSGPWNSARVKTAKFAWQNSPILPIEEHFGRKKHYYTPLYNVWPRRVSGLKSEVHHVESKKPKKTD